MPDPKCPYIEYLFDDLLRTSSGAYRCKAQGLKPEDVNLKTFDYPVCHSMNPKECSFFKKTEEDRLEEKCESFMKDDKGNSVPCINAGKKRYDHGLYSGIHCDNCWDKLIYNARQRSY